MNALPAVVWFATTFTFFPPQRGTESLPDLTVVSLPDLVERLDHSKPARWGNGNAPHSGAILTEIIRRGGPEAEQLLAARLTGRAAELAAAREKLRTLDEASDEAKKLDQDIYYLPENLEMLTALRRIQKKPDPLQIDVKWVRDAEAWRLNDWIVRYLEDGAGGRVSAERLEEGLRSASTELENARKELDLTEDDDGRAAQKKVVEEKETLFEEAGFLVQSKREFDERAPRAAEIELSDQVQANTRSLPGFVVSLRSADVEQVPVHIKFGGDYRTGREARWCFEVKDKDGAILPTRPNDAMMGGGMYQQGELEFGKSWKTVLPMSSFVDIPKPGRYTVTILYHNEETLADIDDREEFKNLIIFRSAPFTLVVEKGPRRVIESSHTARAVVQKLIKKLPDTGAVRFVYGEYSDSFHDFISPESNQGLLLRMGWVAVPSLLDALTDTNVTPHQKAWVLSVLYMITRERDFDPSKHPGALPGYQWRAPGGNGSCGCIITPNGQRAFIDKWLEFRNEYLDLREKAGN